MIVESHDNGRDAIRYLQEQRRRRRRADGHHDAGDRRHRDDPRDPQDSRVQGPADHRRHGEGDEGRPREMHGGGRVGLPVEARRHRADDRRAAGMAGPTDRSAVAGASSAGAACARRVGRRGAANILVVDDRPDKHVVYKAILEELDRTSSTSNSGEEALKQVLERDFAVILLDVNMPGIDGFETAALIRRRKRSAHIPIIFITAELRRRGAHRAGLCARRRRFHGVADRAGDPAVEGQGLRRALPARATSAQAAGARSTSRSPPSARRAPRPSAPAGARRSWRAPARRSAARSRSWRRRASCRGSPFRFSPTSARSRWAAMPGSTREPRSRGAMPIPAAALHTESVTTHRMRVVARGDTPRDRDRARRELRCDASSERRRVAGRSSNASRWKFRAGRRSRSLVILPLIARGRTLGRVFARARAVGTDVPTATTSRWRRSSRAAPRWRSTMRCCTGRSATRIGARTNSWRCSRTSCAIR